jgi:outer membrane receptor protein involved in Fe transport
VPNSQARGHYVNVSAVGSLGTRGSVRVRYQQRRMRDIGFPDFADPYFFNATSLPHSRLDRASVRVEQQALAPWLANLSLTAHFQRTERLLRNVLPIQFPVPTPVTFLPIDVMRLEVLSNTEQRVWTPGVDLQATFVPAPRHLVTAGLTMYRDRSADRRTTLTTTSRVGQVVGGPRGPMAVVFPAPVVLGPPALAEPVRVPNASLRDIAVFAQDEWRVAPHVSVIAGLRADAYAVTTEATPGYDVAPVVAGATPAIDPDTLPDPAGARYSRRALTGDLGIIVNAGGHVSPFLRLGRSYRHPNLEEMLFAGPATVGNLAPNVRVRPEIGTNFDAGAKLRAGRLSGGVYAFVNRYRDFIAQDLVVATTSRGPLAQATNYADVRIHGVELSADAPLVVRGGVLSLAASGAWTRGAIVSGLDPLTGEALDGSPADNITPSKVVAAVRFTERGGRWWIEYGARVQGRVTRVARTLAESPFLIAQDLFALEGFDVHRLGWGVHLGRSREAARLTMAIENLTNAYFREHFQFAPSRGRTLTIGLALGAF